MIFFNCNYCDEFAMIPIVEGLKIQRVACKKCAGVCWLVHSRLEPVSYKDEDVEVDEANKFVKIKAM